MDAQVFAVLVTAGVSVLTTLIALLYGPAWKNRIDARRAREQRSDDLLARYSEPLARAAFDLQSRLYNICEGGFATSTTISDDYRDLSTRWLFGQFLAWVEIIRREVQVIDYGDLRRTAELQRHLFDVSDILASTTIKGAGLRLYRVEQRAVGELMVVERRAGSGGSRRSDCMGFAEFVRRHEADPAFARWFEPVGVGMQSLPGPDSAAVRAALTQRALIDLIDFFDPAQVRFPDVNERGKVTLPPGANDRKRLRPVSEIARFRSSTDLFATMDGWAGRHGLTIDGGEGQRVVRLRGRRWRRCYLLAVTGDRWAELHLVTADPMRAGDPRADIEVPLRLLTGSRLRIVNELLAELGRPQLVPARPRSADW